VPKFQLTLLSSGIDVEDLEELELLMELAPESYVSRSEGQTRVHAALEGASVTRATLKLIGDLQRVIPTFVAHRAELKLVTISDIADSVNMNRESVRLWTTGRRGPGGFPEPFSSIGNGRTKIWAASDVDNWLRIQGLPTPDPRSLSAEEVADVNRAIKAQAATTSNSGVVVNMESWQLTRSSAVSMRIQVFHSDRDRSSRLELHG